MRFLCRFGCGKVGCASLRPDPSRAISIAYLPNIPACSCPGAAALKPGLAVRVGAVGYQAPPRRRVRRSSGYLRVRPGQGSDVCRG